MTIEITQDIHKIGITQNGEIITYSLKFLGRTVELTKSLVNHKYTLESISKLLSVSINELIPFLNSQRFNYMLHCYDSSYEIPQFVYFITFPEFVKIGRTFDLKRRYSPSELKDNVKRIEFVCNVTSAEKELKDEFAKRFEKFSTRSPERFEIPENKINSALKLFDGIIEKYKQKEIKNKEEYIEKFIMDKQFGSGYFVSDVVCSILISAFSRIDYSSCLNVIRTIETSFRKLDKNDFVSVFEEERNLFQYWKYYGYIIILNMTTKEVNISRFWKSILKTDNLKIKTSLYHYIHQDNIQNFLKKYDMKISKTTYKKRPLINGKWAPVVFVHLILHYLNARYMLEVSNMLTEMIFQRKLTIKNSMTEQVQRPMTGGSKMNLIIPLLRESYSLFENEFKSEQVSLSETESVSLRSSLSEKKPKNSTERKSKTKK